MFYILVFINYVADTSNYVLRRTNQDVGRERNSDDKYVILQGKISLPSTTVNDFWCYIIMT